MFNNRTAFTTGLTVFCLDNENVEGLVQKNVPYLVREVSHRGALIKVEGVSVLLASSRFVPANEVPSSPIEVANAGN